MVDLFIKEVIPGAGSQFALIGVKVVRLVAYRVVVVPRKTFVLLFVIEAERMQNLVLHGELAAGTHVLCTSTSKTDRFRNTMSFRNRYEVGVRAAFDNEELKPDSLVQILD